MIYYIKTTGDRRLDNLDFTQLENSELVGLKFELRPPHEFQLFPDYANRQG